MTFGINLFTLRKQIATPQAFLERCFSENQDVME